MRLRMAVCMAALLWAGTALADSRGCGSTLVGVNVETARLAGRFSPYPLPVVGRNVAKDLLVDTRAYEWRTSGRNLSRDTLCRRSAEHRLVFSGRNIDTTMPTGTELGTLLVCDRNLLTFRLVSQSECPAQR